MALRNLPVDEFAALNEEIRALAQAGMPLPTGLRSVSDEYPGRVGAAAGAIAERLEQGEPLEAALGAECGLNEVYAAVVAAGVRSGRLAKALEGVGTTARRAATLRRLVLVSLVYPAALCVLAYVLFLALLTRNGTHTYGDDLYAMFNLGRSPFAFFQTLSETVIWWAWLPPIVFVALLVWFLTSLGRPSGGAWRVPVFGRLLNFSRVASFLELLSLLVENETPLPEACELAGRASANRAIAKSGQELAEKLRRGERSATHVGNQIPPMLQWLILSGVERQMLLNNLRRAADSYSRRTERLSSWMSVYVPLLFSVIVGGGATVAFGIFVLGPWIHFLITLGGSI